MHFFFKQKKQCIITYPLRNPGFLKILNIKGNAILTIIYGTQLIWIIFLPLHTCCTLSQSLGHSGEEGACLFAIHFYWKNDYFSQNEPQIQRLRGFEKAQKAEQGNAVHSSCLGTVRLE